MSVLSKDVLDSWLDRPLHPIEADMVLRVAPGETLFHVEGQGYREENFGDRVIRYHLTISLRHWERRVHTLALWLVPPANEQRSGLLRHGSIEVQVTTVVLREVNAAVLLARPETACFALGADDGGRGDDALCNDAIRLLHPPETNLRRLQLGAAVARAHGPARYGAMLRAMEAQGVEAVIIEDLVKIGEDIGLEKGKRDGVLDLCEVLGVPVDAGRRGELERMSVAELEALARRLKATRAW